MRDKKIQNFAVWLIPSAIQRSQLLSIIHTLARKCESPPFQPHVTLVSGLHDGTLSTLSRRTKDFCKGLGSVSFGVTGVNWTDNYFTFLFLSLIDQSAIFEFAATFFPKADTPKVGPHLSLAYCDRYEDIDRAALARALTGKLPKSLLCTSVELVIPLGGDWREVDHWLSQPIAELGPTANSSQVEEG
jgi:hypothetical protein